MCLLWDFEPSSREILINIPSGFTWLSFPSYSNSKRCYANNMPKNRKNNERLFKWDPLCKLSILRPKERKEHQNDDKWKQELYKYSWQDFSDKKYKKKKKKWSLNKLLWKHILDWALHATTRSIHLRHFHNFLSCASNFFLPSVVADDLTTKKSRRERHFNRMIVAVDLSSTSNVITANLFVERKA